MIVDTAGHYHRLEASVEEALQIADRCETGMRDDLFRIQYVFGIRNNA
jgi:hypothetical protein